MKKWLILFFILFIFVAGFYAVLQSGLGKNYLRDLLSNALHESGFDVQIDRIEGTLPHQIDLKGVTIRGEGVDVTIEELNLRPVLWRLIQREIAFDHIHAKNISLSQGSPFDFDGRFRLTKKRAYLNGKIFDWTFDSRFDRRTRLIQFAGKNPIFNAKGKASLDTNYKLASSNIQITSDRLLSHLPIQAAGRILVSLILTHEENGYQARIQWQIPNLVVDNQKIGPVRGKGNATLADRTLQGDFLIDPYAKASFNFTLRPDWLLEGTSAIDIENLQALHLPNIYGQLQAKGTWHAIDSVQGLHLDATATDFYYGSFYAQRASLYSDLLDPFHAISGLIDIEVEKGKWHDLILDAASMETTRGTESWFFKLFAEGKWKHPLEIHMNGSWSDRFKADIQSLTGTFYNHPFTLLDPVHLEWTQNTFRLPNVEIAIGDANVFVHMERDHDTTDARLRFNRLPLDFLSLNPLDVPIGGTLDLEADIHEENNRLKGSLRSSITQTLPLPATGTFQGQFDRDLLNLTGKLLVRERPLVDVDLSLPIHLSLWPFEATLLTHKNAKGRATFNGRVEEVLDFFDLGPHRLTGQCTCDLRFTNTLYRPLVEGSILFEDGFYENYYTGTQLRNIKADFLAEKNRIYLRNLTAEDGAFTAEGQIDLLQADLYPFRLDATFANLKFVEIDLVTATANGKIHIEGNTTSAVAKGDVEILKSELTIPDHIPRPIPDLQVVYKNPTHPVPPPQTEYHPYPFHLDLHVSAPESITISGRGLSSEWKGDFDLGGTYTALAAKGKLELISGEFNFSSRSFRLTDGALSFSGVEHEMPYLNIAAEMETKGIVITARLKGALDNPQITLQSSPPLPLGSIMSYLLFGQDMSEISGFQALQLATSLASVAGTGPDIMESTRRSLGVDRLRVISEPTEEGGETVALQVGKYISKGVLVSFTQGAEDSSTNVSVEVELKGNLVFQVESDQRQEQGKFTLKWSWHY